MSHHITVSVIVPCYNDGRYLPEAIESVTCLNRDDIELIVVDDGSSDERTTQEITTLEGRGIKVLRQENRGLAAARNAGIANASGEFILPLDSDNRVRDAYFATGVELLRRFPRAGVVYGDAEYFGGRTGLWKIPEFDLVALAKGPYIDACALFRRDVWTSIGGYDETMRLGWEDYDFWLRAAQSGWDFLHLDCIAFDYRVRAGSLLATTNRHIDQIVGYIFGKPQNRVARLLREQALELDVLRQIAGSPDYRLGRLQLKPLRLAWALMRGVRAGRISSK